MATDHALSKLLDNRVPPLVQRWHDLLCMRRHKFRWIIQQNSMSYDLLLLLITIKQRKDKFLTQRALQHLHQYTFLQFLPIILD